MNKEEKKHAAMHEKGLAATVISGGPAGVGLGTMLAFVLLESVFFQDLHNYPVTILLFIWLFVVMIWCAFGVLRHAEVIAASLGEPAGTLVLTFAVTAIEIALLATIMLHGGPNPTLARDTMFATLMLVLNGMVGTALLLGGLRYGAQEYNLEGARAFLVVLAPLAVFALVLPSFSVTAPDPATAPWKAGVFAVIAAAFYFIFLAIQTTRHRSFFDMPDDGHNHDEQSEPVVRDAKPTRDLLFHVAMLFLTLLPIVVLSEYLAVIIDLGIEDLKLPVALGGVFVAIVVLAPEGLTAMNAARANHLQRSVNVCLGSALATLGLTIPAVLIVGLITGRPVQLGLGAEEMVLLVLTLCVSALTFGGSRTTMLQGLVHLLLLAIYIVFVFSP
ncbi:calcium:proton antiporter [Methyloligella sp. 2.7D]|uniref:calcium:proton antiporter n=1 Tax=unclassified Methyloligella TaxID=2625955 RepID=UPI00157C6B99|nr:calcium:proton antiporter [Methyloligella sp. GL2]QKP78014.1 calcium:proton antiporter [Methyloligella sp. GL2]